MTCYFTGTFPTGTSHTKAETARFILCTVHLARTVENLIKSGCTHFITGLENAADMELVDSVLIARRKGLDVKLEAVLPPSKERALSKDDIDYVLEQCGCDIVDREYENDLYTSLTDRNRDIVERSDMILAVWNGKESGSTWDVIEYARMLEKPIKYIVYED